MSVHLPRWFRRSGFGISAALSIGFAACGGSDNAGSDRIPTGNFSGTGASASGGTGVQGWSGNSSVVSGVGGPLILPPPQGGSAAVGGQNQECASALVQTNKNMPSIVFVIDGSGSMCANFGGSTRWQAVRNALLDPMKGLIYRLQSSVSFGAALYDGTIDLGLALGSMSMTTQGGCEIKYVTMKGSGECPALVEVMPPKLSNAMAIDMAYPKVELGGSTPTDKAMKHVMDALIATRLPQAPDQKAQSPVYVILATDGAPNDICVGGVGGDGSAQRQGVIASVDQGAAAGITTWVISLAGNDAALQAHLDEVAKHGDPTNPMARTFSPMNPDDLIMTLAKLLGGAVGCHIALSGKVTVGQECLGTVQQNGKALPCCQQAAGGAWTCNKLPATAPNGWRLSDDHSIELVGDACTNFLIGSGDLLQASFPCAVFVPS
jgi:hypothetical protein